MRFKAMVRLLPMVAVTSLFVLGPGCDTGDPNKAPAAPSKTQAENDAERAAREKAYGKKAQQVTKGPVKAAPAPEAK